MINTLLAIKQNMTSAYDSRGRRVGATVLKVEPNFVTQIKTTDGKDGYDAVQIGMGEKKSVKKPQLGHFKKAGVERSLRFLKEVRIKPVRTASFNKLSDQADPNLEGLELGQEINIGQVFFTGDSIKVTGTSKGRGFQGGVKRHGFHGGPKTHGQSDRHRAPGSIGAGTTPGRVYKGKKMAGHMGNEAVSLTGLEVISVDKSNNLITIKGGIPGPIGSLVILEKQGKVKGYVAPPEPEVEEEEGEGESVKGEEVEKEESLDVSSQPLDESAGEVVQNEGESQEVESVNEEPAEQAENSEEKEEEEEKNA